MPDQRWPLDSFMMGRYVDHSRANITLIKRWVELCQDYHQDCGPIHGNSAFHDFATKGFFGVIDVDSECLTSLPEKAEYIALSYAWGGAEKFTTSIENVRDLRSEGGLSKVMYRLPRAIQDAIKLTKNLEKRYLWVDALCIVQDSDDSWNLNAQIMDRVYGNAFLTICAADDPDASAGLVGLNPSKRRFSQYIEEYKAGVNLMVSHLSETYIRRSNWNTRAWTFQERLLSRRCLLFTRGRVYFQCRATAMSEDIIAEHGGAGWSVELVHAPLQMLADLHTRALRIYTRCVEMYTQRFLSRSGDILAAFSGITNMLGPHLDAEFIFGLPNSHFDWALLWEPRHVLRRRLHDAVTQNGITLKKNLKLPSWAWCGWIGQSHYQPDLMMGALSNLHQWLMNHTWIIWYIRDGHGDLRLVRSPSRLTTPSTDPRWSGYGLIGDGTDAFGRPLPTLAKKNNGLDFKRTLPDYPFNTSKARPDAKPYPNRPDMPFLQFWTWSAYFWLRLEDGKQGRGRPNELQRLSVVDQKGDWCGTVVLDKKPRNLDLGTPFELVALSEAKEFSDEECEDWNYYIQTEREQSEWDLYYVLLIERNKEDIALRLGLGKVFKEAFPNSVTGRSGELGMSWREFVLG